MVEVLEPATTTLDFFHEQVQALGGPVRCTGVVVGKDLATPPGESAAEGTDLGNVIAAAADDRLVEQQRRVGGIVGQVDVTNWFFR